MEEQVVDRNVFEKEIIATSDALLEKWGGNNSIPGSTTLSTPKGEITRVSRTYIFKPSRFAWISIVIGDGYHGDPFQATEILQNVAQYYATEDFMRKVEGSIRVLKAIHKALKD
jgi:hypothetical protein